jgi:ABC-type dipeptide/oligopeptide/nickel transport system ATPase component
MLEALNLTKTFIGPPAVDSVSFTIRPGEILGYLGPNGAGKSTTVKMLTGLLEPTSGRVLFHGQDIRSDLKGFQRCLGYVPEEPHLYPHLSGREYLQLAGLGATRFDIVREVFVSGGRPVLRGLFIGLWLSVALAASLRQNMKGTPLRLDSSDPLLYGGAALLLAAAAALAMSGPARRGSNSNPLDALRCD